MKQEKLYYTMTDYARLIAPSSFDSQPSLEDSCTWATVKDFTAPERQNQLPGRVSWGCIENAIIEPVAGITL